ncbi:MAG: signal peptidase II [Clostridiales bacterium]|nr:signal peptidase II [Clostridiales bacterium]
MIEGILLALILIVDQITKALAVKFCDPFLPVIPGIVELRYAENTGIVWSLFSGGGVRWIFVGLVVVFATLIIWFYIKKRKELTRFSRVILALILAGALGNCIDRAILGYVRDMIYFSIINFPIFNVADISICIGGGLFLLESFARKKNVLSVLEDAWTAK